MARIPEDDVDPVDELDELLTEDELLLEEQELEKLDKARPTRLQRAGGAPRPFSWLLVAAGLVGMWASVELVRAELTWREDPLAALGCDINPVIGCSTFLGTPQGSLLLDIPNAVLGVGAFGALIGVGLVFAAGGRVRRWMWWLLSGVVLGGLAFVVWLAYQSMAVIGSLCPYCVVTWLVVILVGVHLLARAAQAGHLPVTERLARTLVTERWLIVGGAYAVLLVLAVVVFWDKWKLVLGL
ncbi:MAG: vitamin K epoxide reductase family protein [Actinobacteria bacterium]|nr:vitamin K epoxide reductase family protein [Actinomycetota bacterium]